MKKIIILLLMSFTLISCNKQNNQELTLGNTKNKPRKFIGVYNPSNT